MQGQENYFGGGAENKKRVGGVRFDFVSRQILQNSFKSCKILPRNDEVDKIGPVQNCSR